MTKKAQTAEVIPAELPQTALKNPNPMTMLQYALENGFSLDHIDRIMQLERQWKADIAREAFNAALAKWKETPVQIIKDKVNAHYGNSYSSIGNQVNPVNASMAPFGLSTDWTLEQADGRITVTCTLTHTLGHSRTSKLSGPPDSSGSKNALQQIKSTVTYLELATHQAVTGVVASDAANLDDDGNAGGAKDKVITGAQRATIAKLIKETEADEALFLDWVSESVGRKIETLADLPAKEVDRCMAMLNRKKREATEGEQ